MRKGRGRREETEQRGDEGARASVARVWHGCVGIPSAGLTVADSVRPSPRVVSYSTSYASLEAEPLEVSEPMAVRPDPSTVLSFNFDSDEVRSCETSRSQSLLPSTGASALSARVAVSLLREMSLTPAARLAWADCGDSYGDIGIRESREGKGARVRGLRHLCGCERGRSQAHR